MTRSEIKTKLREIIKNMSGTFTHEDVSKKAMDEFINVEIKIIQNLLSYLYTRGEIDRIKKGTYKNKSYGAQDYQTVTWNIISKWTNHFTISDVMKALDEVGTEYTMQHLSSFLGYLRLNKKLKKIGTVPNPAGHSYLILNEVISKTPLKLRFVKASKSFKPQGSLTKIKEIITFIETHGVAEVKRVLNFIEGRNER